ncbi:MAG TPA: hypothetical protein PK182_00445 [Bacillota bacterium]|nr:hypothetical protein [Bacillota bacterium]HOH09476.1 hypothetical protein [Bacillota bacterium]HOY88172.1 hypothetical protein [Bacillota bacterium]
MPHGTEGLRQLPGPEDLPVRVRKVLSLLRQDGHLAYVVGGAVRDLLLTGAADDWDVATSAMPARVKELFPRNSPQGEKHGSIMAVFDDGKVDITTFRREGKYSDLRRPDDVSFLPSVENDLSRRDFTVNAMAWDPYDDVLVDPFGGTDDIGARIIRAVGDPHARFSEDALRMMRALRFASILCFKVDEEALRAMKGQAGGIAKVSAERKAAELGRMIAGKCAGAALSHFVSTGLAVRLFPDLDPRGMAQAARYMDELPAKPLLRLAALFACGDTTGPHRVDENSKARAEELRMSRGARTHIARLTEGLFEGYRLSDGPSVRRWAALLGWEDVEDGLELRSWYDRNIRKRPDWAKERQLVRQVLEARPPLSKEQLMIGGTDLVKLTGSAGPKVNALMNKLLLDVLDSPELNTKERLTMLAWAYLRGKDYGGV